MSAYFDGLFLISIIFRSIILPADRITADQRKIPMPLHNTFYFGMTRNQFR